MYIKEIKIEGFKSYQKQTVISEFDPLFNAITGQNGTGKSNILDAICFVFGITNVKQLRANRTEDLIYKSGKAGISRASVTLLFDNTDSNRLPINYEHLDEISVTRTLTLRNKNVKNTYFINGLTVQNKKIHDLFNSVQLNVNNPHFLIMQGMITKVLNMKPKEILHMLEEAAGTNLYEEKKMFTQRTIDRKNVTVCEITGIFNEEINPKIDNFETEKQNFTEYKKCKKETQHYSKYYTAGVYLELSNSMQICEKGKIEAETSILDFNKFIKEREQEKIELEKKCSLLESEKDNDHQMKRDLENSFSARNEKYSKIQMSLNESLSDLEQEKAASRRLKNIDGSLKKYEEAKLENEENLKKAKEKQRAVLLNVSTKDGASDTWKQNMVLLKDELTNMENEKQRLILSEKEIKYQLNQNSPLLEAARNATLKDRQEIKNKTFLLSKLEIDLKNINYTERLTGLKIQFDSLHADCNNLNIKLDEFKTKYNRLTFKFDNPCINFDRKQVRGLVLDLFSVNENYYCKAIEVAAGSKLYQVAVNNDDVAQLLIENGNLKRRTTFVPLNRIRGHRVSNDVLQLAKKLVGDNVFQAQDLVSYDPEYKTLIDWAFGETLICTTLEAAETVAFHKNIRKKAVTIDGDVFDPSGTISGGAAEKTSPILLIVKEMRQLETNNKIKNNDLMIIKNELEVQNSLYQKFKNKTNEVNLLRAEIQRAKERLENSPEYQLECKVAQLEQSLSENSNKQTEITQNIITKNEEYQNLKEKVNNMNTWKEMEIKECEEEVQRLSDLYFQKDVEYTNKKKLYQQLKAELDELERSVHDLSCQFEQNDVTCTTLNKNLHKLSSELKEAEIEKNEIDEKIAAINKSIRDKMLKMQLFQESTTKISTLILNKELESKKFSLKVKAYEEELDETQEKIDKLVNENQWLKMERKTANQIGSYDFSSVSLESIKNKLVLLQENLKFLKTQFNKNSIMESDELSKELILLQHKQNAIDDNKITLDKLIVHLDQRKRMLVRNACLKVNHAFDSILNSLLPGTNAKLEPVSGSFEAGLTINVSFGGIWKETAELSGGQRSLVALSLILSMLMFKPAPIYILDEIDAALDLDHTQNIGGMLKTHFNQSQFIVVSLKEGMFDNANVLYRTEFLNGTSKVERIKKNDE